MLAFTFTTEHAGYVLLVPFKGGFSRILEEICATNSKFDQKFESLKKKIASIQQDVEDDSESMKGRKLKRKKASPAVRVSAGNNTCT